MRGRVKEGSKEGEYGWDTFCVRMNIGADRVAQVVEYLPSKREALSSNPITAQKEN
jgi:hypothetical protein